MVKIRCDVILQVIEKIDSNRQLQDMFGKPVSEALVVAAEGGSIRIENGGSVELTEGQKRRFLEVLSSVLEGVHMDSAESKPGHERVRIRCDVMASIIRALGNNKELRDVFGKPVLESLVLVADEGDLRVENGSTVDLSEEHKVIFLGILNKIVSENTS